jgi:hypothetical protein
MSGRPTGSIAGRETVADEVGDDDGVDVELASVRLICGSSCAQQTRLA